MLNAVIERSLWVGNAGDCRDIERLRAAEIEAVVDLAIEESPASLPRDLIHIRFPLVDGGDNPAGLLAAVVTTVCTLIETPLRTAVCCSAGASRSPVVAAAVIARVQGIPFGEALAQVGSAVSIDPSPRLAAQLEALGKR